MLIPGFGLVRSVVKLLEGVSEDVATAEVLIDQFKVLLRGARTRFSLLRLAGWGTRHPLRG